MALPLPSTPLHPGERTGPEGKPIANHVLLALDEPEFRALRPRLKYVAFEHHDVLHESHAKADTVFFPNEGLVSLVVVMSNGKTAEAGVVGNEGIAGLEGLLGYKRGPLREIVQVAGNAHAISGDALLKLLPDYPGLWLHFSRFAILNRMQVSQTAACNRLHQIENRLARWLLMTQDRVDSGLIAMTHDFLATMLGTDRASVTEAALLLQKRKIIEYARGSVRILDRKALEQVSCECYDLIRQYNGALPSERVS